MLLNNYLEKLTQALLIPIEEKELIRISLKELQDLIKNQFLSVSEHFCFGSYVRNTNLSTYLDPHADVDYLVVFKKDQEEDPDELLDQISIFLVEHFKNQDIIQLKPTGIVSINGIRFELVPAYRDQKYFINYKIPTVNEDETVWYATDPHEITDTLLKENEEHDSHLIPVIKLLKYWNIINQHVYTSYELERHVVFMDYPKLDCLKDYLFYAIDNLSTDELDEEKQQRVEHLKSSILTIQQESDEECALYHLSIIFPFI